MDLRNGFRSLPALFLFFPVAVRCETLYLDGSLKEDCDKYDVVSRSCGAGSERAFAEPGPALSKLVAGDTLLLREGRYAQLEIPVSGQPGSPIAIRSYPGETATISDKSNVAIRVTGKSDIVVAGLSVDGVVGFGRVENSTGIEFDKIVFRHALASGTTGALKFVRSSRNRVEDSSFDDGSDLLLLQDDSNLNVLLNNRFGRAAHSLVSVRCSSRNIIRGNSFNNPKEKSVEIFDCEGVSDAPVRLDDTKFNLMEFNRFEGTAESSRDYYFNAIQHGGQHTIVRYNLFTDNRGGGVNYQYYSDESLFVYGNRLYNNTFYRNDCHAIIGQSGRRSQFRDNLVLDNLLYDNRDCDGRPGQTHIKDPRSVVWLDNAETGKDPRFVDAANGDFHLSQGSSMIDAGSFATRAASSGSGTTLRVKDASWFFDGYGIDTEQGDIVRIEGHPETARILQVDYEHNTLMLETGLQWRRGDGVHVLYSGDAPDMGAFEAGPDSLRERVARGRREP